MTPRVCGPALALVLAAGLVGSAGAQTLPKSVSDVKVVPVVDATIPYHPAAIKFYKDQGLWKPEMDQMQQKLLALNP